MRSIIEVKNIGKRYNINHQKGGYVALRDVLSNIARSPARWFGGKVKAAMGLENPNDFWALKDINFKVEQGEVLGIIGRNGAGKSTLLRIVNGLIKPDQGRVRVRGKVDALIALGAAILARDRPNPSRYRSNEMR